MTALLSIEGLRAGYGKAQVLDGVTFSMDAEAVCLVGRNGMGKSTLCNTIMGLIRATDGSIRLDGADVAGMAPEQVARRGIAYVPQGRRLFASLTVDEHLRMIARKTRGERWTADAVYELFPRLAARRRHGGSELSGGEQQMLAVARALMLNGRLVMMDEPSEGLAPTIVDSLIDAVHQLVREGVGVLVVEQNLRAATEIADRQLVMVSGRIETETTAQTLANDTQLQRRYLGVDA